MKRAQTSALIQSRGFKFHPYTAMSKLTNLPVSSVCPQGRSHEHLKVSEDKAKCLLFTHTHTPFLLSILSFIQKHQPCSQLFFLIPCIQSISKPWQLFLQNLSRIPPYFSPCLLLPLWTSLIIPSLDQNSHLCPHPSQPVLPILESGPAPPLLTASQGSHPTQG